MERNIALLIDFENIAAGTEKEGLGKFDVDKVIARIKDKGRILIARSYADWGRFARFKQGLLTANVTMYELTSHGMQDKNRADIAMVVDCLELAYTRDYIDTFVVVSGDSDFTPLVLKLKELNKAVIGVGTRKSTSRLIINACDEFIFYDSIVQATTRRPKTAPTKKVSGDKAKAFEFLVEVLDGMQREDPTPPHASVLKSAILRRQPDFNEGDLGFGSFTRFVEAARDAGYVLLSRDKKSGGYMVDTVEDTTEEAPRAEEPKAVRKDGIYDDPYFPAGSEPYIKRLHAAGLTPLSAPTRLAVLEALVGAVEERNKKRRRVNIQFMVEDLKNRLRRTCPDLSPDHLRGLLRALMRAGCLMHKDGAPIRNASAQFTLRKDAAQLNQALAGLYLRHLRDEGVDLTSTSVLADLLFGDPERTRDVEETIAWLDAPGNEAFEVDEDDDLLQVDDEEDHAAATPTPPRERAAATVLDDDLDALLLTDDAPEATPAPGGDQAAAVDATTDDEGSAKRKRKRSSRKKDAPREEAPTADLDLDDALFQVDEPPATPAPAPSETAPVEAPAAIEAEVAAGASAEGEAGVLTQAAQEAASAASEAPADAPAADAGPAPAAAEPDAKDEPAAKDEPKPKRRTTTRRKKAEEPADA